MKPEHAMHDYGCYAENVKLLVADFSKQMEQLCDELNDALIIITADHGLRNMKRLSIEDYPNVYECLQRNPSIESRCISFFVKYYWKQVFADRFENQFGDKFLLFTKEESLAQGFFGTGRPHKKSLDFIGDYIAVAIGDTSIWYRDDKGGYKDFKAAHAVLVKQR